MASALYPAVIAQRPLRVGVLLDSFQAPAWVEWTLRSLLEAGYVSIVAVLIDTVARNASAGAASSQGTADAFENYAKRDAARYRRPQSALTPHDVAPLLQSVWTLNLAPPSSAAVCECVDDDVRAVRARDLDVLLDFGSRTIRGDLPSAARLGLWSYCCADVPRQRGEADFFVEMLARNPRTVTGLYAATDAGDGADVLFRSAASTNFLSLELSRNYALWKSASFASRALRRAAVSDEAVSGTAPERVRIEPRAPLPHAPRMLEFFARSAVDRVRSGWRRRTYEEHWILGYRCAAALLDPESPSMMQTRALPPPRGHFYADPCIVTQEGRDFLFFEDFDYATELGNIACVEFSAQGPLGEPRLILQTGSHLSYPFVFEADGIWYMIPESGAARRVSLYRAREFPWQWEHVADLLEGHNAVDATLWRHQGRWYLFTAIAESGGIVHDELFLFHAGALTGPWLPHPCNPVVSDVGRARPAGALFLRDGRLIRPAQDCAINYGRAVVFNEVLELSPQNYRERALGRLDGSWHRGLHGCHTYSTNGRIEVVDGKYFARKGAVR